MIRLLDWLAQSSWQLAVLGLLVAAVDRILRSEDRFELRALLWNLLPVKLLLPVGLVTAVALPHHRWSPVSWASGSLDGSREADAALLLLWLVVALPSGGAVVWRQARFLRGVRERGDPAPEALRAVIETLAEEAGLRRAPTALVVDGLAGPAVTGVLRPKLLLPPAVLRDIDLRHALRHELVHLRRGDLRWQALWALAAVVLWFHPLIWLARRRAHTLRELATDAVAARLGGSARGYQAALVRCAARSGAAETPQALAMASGSTGSLVRRLRALDRLAATPGVRPGPWSAGRGRRALRMLPAALVAAMALLPTVGSVEAEPPAPRVELVRAALRQTPGTGSLHVRYAVMQLDAMNRSSTSTEDP